MRSTSARRSWISVIAIVVVGASSIISVSGVGPAGAAAIPRPDGAGPPVAASGMGTQAALDNPRCRHDDPRYGPYGRFDSTEKGGGPTCVKEWKAGADNGGATARGVTKDKIRVVAFIGNEAQADPDTPKVRADNSTGTMQDALYDYLLPQMKFYETWGRDLEIKFVVSTGTDEASQRADLLTVTGLKPFAVLMLVQPREGLAVIESGLARSKILVLGYSASPEDMATQAPYRWNSTDSQATAINAAVVLGKQLVGKKAEFGGEDVQDDTRTFGVVYTQGTIDYPGFLEQFGKFRGKVAAEASFTDAAASDGAQIQSQAVTITARMKEAGVTTVVFFTNFQQWQSLMSNASSQDYFPEWFFTGAGFNDLGIIVRFMPPAQTQHAFGISAVSPWVTPATPTASGVPYAAQVDPLNWYWGAGVGTSNARLIGPVSRWLLPAIQAAGPNLTPKTFTQGLFATPPRGGAADGEPDGTMIAYGKGPGLPYDEYAMSGYDFAPYWWDTETTGPSNGVGTVGKGVGQYPDGAKRYVASTWPKKPIAWFDENQSVFGFDTRPTPPLGYAGDCEGCPSTGGPGNPKAPSNSAVIFEAGGTGASAG